MRKSSRPGKKPAKKAVVLASSTGVEVGSKGDLSGKAITERKTAIPRADGRGALLPGGQFGNKGGGSTPNELRTLMRGTLSTIIPMVQAMAVDPELSPKERLAAADMLCRYGIGTRQEVEHQGITVVVDTRSVRQADD